MELALVWLPSAGALATSLPITRYEDILNTCKTQHVSIIRLSFRLDSFVIKEIIYLLNKTQIDLKDLLQRSCLSLLNNFSNQPLKPF